MVPKPTLTLTAACAISAKTDSVDVARSDTNAVAAL